MFFSEKFRYYQKFIYCTQIIDKTVFDSAFQFAPEEWIYRAGEMANDVFFVASGAVEELGERDAVIVHTADALSFSSGFIKSFEKQIFHSYPNYHSITSAQWT